MRDADRMDVATRAGGQSDQRLTWVPPPPFPLFAGPPSAPVSESGLLTAVGSLRQSVLDGRPAVFTESPSLGTNPRRRGSRVTSSSCALRNGESDHFLKVCTNAAAM